MDCVLKLIENNIVWLAQDNELESSAIIENETKEEADRKLRQEAGLKDSRQAEEGKTK